MTNVWRRTQMQMVAKQLLWVTINNSQVLFVGQVLENMQQQEVFY